MAQPANISPQEMLQPAHLHPPSNSYYPENNSDLSGGLPINLDSLRDGPPGSKPFYPYSTLIRYAIKGSPNQRLLLEDIYYAIESRFPYFRTAPSGWKNSVRHNLSLNPCFEKVARPLTDRGKGSYWTVNDQVDPRTGVHRIRKKKPKAGSRNDPLEDDIDYHSADGAQAFDPNMTFPPPPMDNGGPGPSRSPAPFTAPPFPSFDPAFAMGLPLFRPDEQFEVDEHGQVNWRAQWRKELDQLREATDEQEKLGADQEWFRMMLFRVRTAMMAPPGPPPPPPMNVNMNPDPGMAPQNPSEA